MTLPVIKAAMSLPMAEAATKTRTRKNPSRLKVVPKVRAGGPSKAKAKTDSSQKSVSQPAAWIAQFIWADAAGGTHVDLMTIEAPTREAAKAFAVKCAPAVEFMVTVHSQSDEQFLGQVRHRALNAARRGD